MGMRTFRVLEVSVVLLTVAVISSVDGTGNLDCDWTIIDNESDIKQISVGPAGVWAIDGDDQVYYREGTYRNDGSQGTAWTQLKGIDLKQIDVGGNVVWALNSSGHIFIRSGMDWYFPTGCSWHLIDGGLLRISVSPKGHVWGIDYGKQAVRRVGVTKRFPQGFYWEPVDEGVGALVEISVSDSGVWAICENGTLMYRKGTYNDPDSRGDKWVALPDGLDFITSGRGKVWGLKNQFVTYRTGVSEFSSTGETWGMLDKKLVYFDVWGGSLWGVDNFIPPQVHARLI